MKKEEHISKQRKIVCDRNIKIKIRALLFFIEKGIPWLYKENGEFIRDPITGQKILDFYPKNKSHFVKWNTGSGKEEFQNQESTRSILINNKKIGSFDSFSADSLKKRQQTEAKILKHLKQIKEVVLDQVNQEVGTKKIAITLKMEKERLTIIASHQQGVIAQKENEILKLQHDLNKAKRANVSSQNYYLRKIAAMQKTMEKKDQHIFLLESTDKISKKGRQ